ncbi:plekstrin domain protein [Acrasis kona]|uniref:Plekstrin domain protein n=1 Tax=Acrasis kona TaxID=1008807 RepID=A0AAW2YK66_9EUKA
MDDSPLVKEYRNKMWMSGWLTKQGQRVKNWKKRYFVLRGSILEYYKSDSTNEGDLMGKINIKGKCLVKYVGEVQDVEIDQAIVAGQSEYDSEEEDGASASDVASTQFEKLKDDNSYPFKFYLLDDDRNLIMAAQTYEEAKEWIRIIRNVVNVEQYFDDLKRYRVQTPLYNVMKLFLEDTTKQDLVLKNEWVAGDAIKSVSETVLKKNLVPITKFGLVECGLSDDYMISIGEGLGVNETVKELDLSHNRIGDNGVGDLCDGLILNVTVEKLNLGNNLVCDVGSVFISEVIRATVSINSINLSHNHITSIGAMALSSALVNNELLVNLELGYNEIGDEGVKQLAEGLKNNKCLKKLGLSNNGIGSEGLTVFCEVGLIHNRTLEEIDLTGNEFDKNGADALVNALKDHKSITKVDCGNNSKLSADGITTLAQILKSRFLVSQLVMTRIK